MKRNGNGNGTDATMAMSLEISAHNVEMTAKFREYIEDRIRGLENIWPRIDDARVRFLEEHGVFSAEITLVSAGLITRGEEHSDASRAAFDFALEKIERQLRRYKKKSLARERRHDNRDGFSREGVLGSPLSEAELHGQANGNGHDHDDHYDKRVRTKRFAVKPMSADEAALQMDLLGHNFFVFLDATTNDVSVVYKRRSGGYGLLEPILD
jgi:putative sigma-54 modulation protein